MQECRAVDCRDPETVLVVLIFVLQSNHSGPLHQDRLESEPMFHARTTPLLGGPFDLVSRVSKVGYGGL